MCDCIDKINTKLEEKGNDAIVDCGYMCKANFIYAVPKIKLKRKSTGKAVTKKTSIVYASYCPFCGKKLEPVEE